MLLLTGLQGAMGWYMVKSGLTERTDVSQYRLAAHLALALVLFMLAVWTAADLLARPVIRAGAGAGAGAGAAWSRGLRRHASFATGLVLVTALAGALVAGTNAGKAYNEFPLMAGRVVPAGYLALDPWYRNLFENVAAVQFNHRLLAVLVVLVVGTLAVRLARSDVPPRWRGLALALGLVVAGQFALGILTLLRSVPVGAAALHQAGAVVLLDLTLLAVHRLRAASEPVPAPGRVPPSAHPAAPAST
jgi:cytochrome c oxidase assembly protein subunit 15